VCDKLEHINEIATANMSGCCFCC